VVLNQSAIQKEKNPFSYPCQHSMKWVALNTHFRNISNQQRLEEVIKNTAK
jgi:hypothetical protein